MACKLGILGMTLSMLCVVGSASAQGLAETSEDEADRFRVARYQTHRSCPSQEFFRAKLDEALGPQGAIGAQGAAPARGSMQISILIEKKKNRYQLQLTTEEEAGNGTRTIEAPRCKELLATAAVIVSLAMQPDLLFQNESQRAVQSGSSYQGQAGDDEVPGRVRRDANQRGLLDAGEGQGRSLLKIAVGLAAVTDLGTLPRPAIGLGVVASARADRYLLSFRLTQWAEQRSYVRSFKEDRGGNFDLITATLTLCRDLVSGRLSAGTCGLLGLGRLSGESIVIDAPISQAHIMANLGPAAFAHLQTSENSAIRIQGELVAQLVRPNYSAELLDENNDEVAIKMHIHKVGAVSARLALSWGLRF